MPFAALYILHDICLGRVGNIGAGASATELHFAGASDGNTHNHSDDHSTHPQQHGPVTVGNEQHCQQCKFHFMLYCYQQCVPPVSMSGGLALCHTHMLIAYACLNI